MFKRQRAVCSCRLLLNGKSNLYNFFLKSFCKFTKKYSLGYLKN